MTKTKINLHTGNSSFPFQISFTFRCVMTCLIFKSAGRAAHPALTLKNKNNYQ